MKKTATWIGCALLFLTFSQAGISQTMSFGNAVEKWSQACGKDVEKYCKGVKPGNNRLTSCLSGKASPVCQAATGAFRANMDKRFAAQAKVLKICKSDAERLCSGFKSGQARVLRCLMRKDNFRAATKACKVSLRDAGWLDKISN